MSMQEFQEDGQLPAEEEAEEFYEKYQLKEVLGRGLSSTVRRCRNKMTGEEFAVKILDKAEHQDMLDLVEAETEILSLLNHPNIIHLEEAFELSTHFFLVFELAEGGELFDLLTEVVYFPEAKARSIMYQILHAVDYFHKRQIIHRDLKPENILLMTDGTIKISDFGFAKVIEDGETLRELCGTPGYMSPEAIECYLYGNDVGYSMPSDMWACGVIMYTIMVGFPPFWNQSRMVLLRTIMKGKYEFVAPFWDHVSESAKDLVRRLLTTDPNKRITAAQALEHEWIAELTTMRKENQERTVSARQRFRAAVFAIMATHHVSFSKRMSVASTVEADSEMSTTTADKKAAKIRDLYRTKKLRKTIDECAFKIYGHWVKKNNEQNRAALFENLPRPVPPGIEIRVQ
eukprot:Clim_evm69s11 gene=Clim_evmTU69s11